MSSKNMVSALQSADTTRLTSNADDLVIRARAMSSLPKATVRNYLSICNQLDNRAPLAQREHDVFMNDTDFVALVEQEEYKAFDGFVEDILTMMPWPRLTRVSLSRLKHRLL